MADVKTNAKCINKGRPVYFSYARNSSKQPGWDHISDCVDEIIAIFKEQNIEYRLDRDDIGAGDSISEFEKEIGWNSEVVVLVFSDKYFHSPHCMYEFIQIKNAIKKYPKKRLFCIKAGDFDLSDRNYIRELEHFWGTKKLDYEEIEYHRIRKHSGTEKAARQNGFYINEIRELESYFTNTNYVEASNQDWNGFVNKITDYYESAPKSPFYAQMQRKLSLSKFRFFVFGIILLAFLMVGIPYLINKIYSVKSRVVEIPEYVQNDFLDSTQITYITKIKVMEKYYTQVFFRSINLTDEYPRKVLRNTTPHLIVDGKNYYFTSVQSSDGNLMQEHFKGGKGTVVDYQMLFPTIPVDADTIDYVEGDGRGIFGISMIRDNKISIDHPAYNAGLSE
ncbi:MAG: toll/interleukin-1 receptor domain-containing protein, partial [Bacteroidales bacterium]|nr:toll/interleukin-1 receptor domain-containing protein [Bacteroidales bacterium]